MYIAQIKQEHKLWDGQFYLQDDKLCPHIDGVFVLKIESIIFHLGYTAEVQMFGTKAHADQSSLSSTKSLS